MRALLDVSVLIALLDENHVRHASSSNWLAKRIESGWASCPLTQNGCVRILCQPRYSASLGIPTPWASGKPWRASRPTCPRRVIGLSPTT